MKDDEPLLFPNLAGGNTIYRWSAESVVHGLRIAVNEERALLNVLPKELTQLEYFNCVLLVRDYGMPDKP